LCKTYLQEGGDTSEGDDDGDSGGDRGSRVTTKESGLTSVVRAGVGEGSVGDGNISVEHGSGGSGHGAGGGGSGVDTRGEHGIEVVSSVESGAGGGGKGESGARDDTVGAAQLRLDSVEGGSATRSVDDVRDGVGGNVVPGEAGGHGRVRGEGESFSGGSSDVSAGTVSEETSDLGTEVAFTSDAGLLVDAVTEGDAGGRESTSHGGAGDVGGEDSADEGTVGEGGCVDGKVPLTGANFSAIRGGDVDICGPDGVRSTRDGGERDADTSGGVESTRGRGTVQVGGSSVSDTEEGDLARKTRGSREGATGNSIARGNSRGTRVGSDSEHASTEFSSTRDDGTANFTGTVGRSVEVDVVATSIGDGAIEGDRDVSITSAVSVVSVDVESTDDTTSVGVGTSVDVDTTSDAGINST